ncbi:hypothetical protein NP233_g6933 [Leucocoprinus birnbaumii]|uniref:Nephrocystin 3-like N-terminal domain-containing protein n=1 Tax=Leucocoprinus birnbaumii TaxID=56174 RepID=A0AAD5VSX4_9AGAR|nr:hypothetical protein NP233_g6933 [Leucocoprinus birnbaumii]
MHTADRSRILHAREMNPSDSMDVTLERLPSVISAQQCQKVDNHNILNGHDPMSIDSSSIPGDAHHPSTPGAHGRFTSSSYKLDNVQPAPATVYSSPGLDENQLNNHPASFKSVHGNGHSGYSSGREAQSAFFQASNFAVYNPTFNQFPESIPDMFMENFAEHAITAAVFDSSHRDPPPRCHPGTRLETIECVHRFYDAGGKQKKLLWIVGPAGVGKSAIMQSIAETSPNLGATFFFSAGAYDDPSKVIQTLAYQIAVRHETYRHHLRWKLSSDPTLFSKSMTAQFSAFFTEPFAESMVVTVSHQLLILIDGLDECSGIDEQRRLLHLISTFATTHPHVPLLWTIASRPEPHISSFFNRPSLASVHDQLVLEVNSSGARQDVERYLREELTDIRASHPALSYKLRWPSEPEFLSLAIAADGLFIFATTSLLFINDPTIGDPASQLQLLLKVLDRTTAVLPHTSASPLARLYALYEGILNRVPRHILPDTHRLLLGNGVISKEIDTWGSLMWACSFLGMSPESAYGALHHLHSVLYVPSPFDADHEQIRCHHKSFSDYLLIRFPNVETDWDELQFYCAVRILKDIPEVPSREPFNHVVLHWPEKAVPFKQQRREIYLYASHDLTNSAVLSRYLFGPNEGAIHPDIIHALRTLAIGPDPHEFVSDRGSTYGWFLLESEKQTLACDKLEHDWSYSQRRDGTYRLTKIAECGCECNQPVWNHFSKVKADRPQDRRSFVYVPAHRCGIVIVDWHDGPKQWRFVFPYFCSP